MNRYPLWKYLLVLVVLILGVVYSMPNIFGESPAVQISTAKTSVKLDSALLGQVENVLKQGNLQFEAIFLDANGVKVRFNDPDTQIKAKDALQTTLGKDYVVALNLLSRSPSWLRSIGALPMYLGLDLRGGVHFLLQVDMKAALSKRMEGAVNDIRGNLREKRIQYSGVTREGETVIVRFRDKAAREKGQEELAQTLPDLDFRSVDEAGEFRLTGTLKQTAITATQKAALDQNITTLRN